MKFFSDDEKRALTERLNIAEGDLILFGADKWDVACEVLGRIRLRVMEVQRGQNKAGRMLPGETLPVHLHDSFDEKLNFLWVIDFPLLALLARRTTNGTPCIIRSRVRTATTWNCSNAASSEKSARRLTTWCSTAWKSAAAASGSTSRICRRRCSRCSA